MSTRVIQSFDQLQKLLEKAFKDLSAGDVRTRLYYCAIDREEIWDKYLSGFTDEDRQEHNCNCCRSFLRQYGGIVSIAQNMKVTLWDMILPDVGENFKQAITNLRDYIQSLPVTEIFLSPVKKCGTQRNLDRKLGLLWQHLFVELADKFVVGRGQRNINELLSEARDDKNVLKRSLEELTLDATDTVLELIAQPHGLYRGKESEHLLNKFVLLQRQYKRIPQNEKDNFCWVASGDSGTIVSRIRNTAIGTLLIDLSAGMGIDEAVAKFEAVVAPHNYKRPTALVSPHMIEDAKAKLNDLGLLEALNRRFATETDIQVCNLLFKDRPQVLTDVFDQMSKDTLVNPRTLSKSDEIGIEDFIDNIVPDAKRIDILVENTHLNNFVSLLAPVDQSEPTLFKWSNGFSWSYTGNIADSIKERVKQAGGNVVGELRCSLSWGNYDDLDIHVVEPDGSRIFYGHKHNLASGGKLDVDMNVGYPGSRSPVENIIWTEPRSMKEGIYKVEVNNYSRREEKDTGYAVQIECKGEVFNFEFRANPRQKESHVVAQFRYNRAGGVHFQDEVKSNVLSKEKWGVKTNRWSKVTQFLLSPNHWEQSVGNKHYIFCLENCVSDESPRPFFNEMLKPELNEHRKVFEILGGKVKIEDSPNQLSGVGFSDTQRASLIARVHGKFMRTLKVNF